MAEDHRWPREAESEAGAGWTPPDTEENGFQPTVIGHAPFTPETTPPLAPSRLPLNRADDPLAPPPTIVASPPASAGMELSQPDEPTPFAPPEEGLEFPATEPELEPAEAELGPSLEEQERERERTRTIIRELLETALIALLVFLAVRASFQNFKVDGSSMYPTLHNGQFLIVNKLVYTEVDVKSLSKFVPFLNAGATPKRHVFHAPQRGDIIVLVDPQRQSTDLVKRVIGLPGDTIEISDGKVYIDGRLLVEPYITAAWHDTQPRVQIPAGEYFVMGDNRANSLDSRSPQVGLIPEDHIIGKAVLSYWPTDRFGLAPNATPTFASETTSQTTSMK